MGDSFTKSSIEEKPAALQSPKEDGVNQPAEKLGLRAFNAKVVFQGRWIQILAFLLGHAMGISRAQTKYMEHCRALPIHTHYWLNQTNKLLHSELLLSQLYTKAANY